jgi:hypothetical protein
MPPLADSIVCWQTKILTTVQRVRHQNTSRAVLSRYGCLSAGIAVVLQILLNISKGLVYHAAVWFFNRGPRWASDPSF